LTHRRSPDPDVSLSHGPDGHFLGSAQRPKVMRATAMEVEVDRQLSRRSFLGGAGAGLAGIGLAGVSACGKGSTSGSGGPKTIEMTWWGSTDRHRRTRDALAAFG